MIIFLGNVSWSDAALVTLCVWYTFKWKESLRAGFCLIIEKVEEKRRKSSWDHTFSCVTPRIHRVWVCFWIFKVVGRYYREYVWSSCFSSSFFRYFLVAKQRLWCRLVWLSWLSGSRWLRISERLRVLVLVSYLSCRLMCMSICVIKISVCLSQIWLCALCAWIIFSCWLALCDVNVLLCCVVANVDAFGLWQLWMLLFFILFALLEKFEFAFRGWFTCVWMTPVFVS